MHILILHPENRNFGGAERMLEHFCAELPRSNRRVTVGVASHTRLQESLPKTVQINEIPGNGRFSLGSILKQIAEIVALHRRNPFDLIHGWASRDWDLTAILGALLRRPTIGTLHDHPTSTYISPRRQRLMRWSAALGLKRIVCVSRAVQHACLAAGYPAARVNVVHNGLPPLKGVVSPLKPDTFRLGFLGAFSETKGFPLLFEIVDRFAERISVPWELHLAGDALDEAGRQFVVELKRRWAGRTWWERVRWYGWLNDPKQFLAGLSLLVFPSAEFDSLPTVLLESGQLGVPALAASVGGVSEIILDNDSGWLFEPHDARQPAAILERLIQDPAQCGRVGDRARKRIEQLFPVTKMVADYSSIYSTVTTHV